jgi:hypothetical protein
VGRIVIDLFGMHGANDADFVGDRGDVRKNTGDLLAGLATLGEIAKRPPRFEDGVLQLGQLLALCERRRERLTVELCQLWLEVERFDM